MRLQAKARPVQQEACIQTPYQTVWRLCGTVRFVRIQHMDKGKGEGAGAHLNA